MSKNVVLHVGCSYFSTWEKLFFTNYIEKMFFMQQIILFRLSCMKFGIKCLSSIEIYFYFLKNHNNFSHFHMIKTLSNINRVVM